MSTQKKHIPLKEKTSESKQKSTLQNNELLEVVPIPDTPFQARRFEDKWFVTIGKYKASPLFNNLQECIEAVYSPNWEILTLAMQAVVEANQSQTTKI